jgi:hypothetical protein
MLLASPWFFIAHQPLVPSQLNRDECLVIAVTVSLWVASRYATFHASI